VVLPGKRLRRVAECARERRDREPAPEERDEGEPVVDVPARRAERVVRVDDERDQDARRNRRGAASPTV
jgi:hypothetical protein